MDDIPKADVVEDVETYLKQQNMSLEDAQKFVEDRYRKYKTVEANMNERTTRLVANLPDFNRALEYISVCRQAQEKGKTEVEMLCKVEENSYQRFRITDLQNVVLVLGCNTFAEFSLDEAEKLLKENVSGIEKTLAKLREDLDFVRDQITTSEVAIAHFYNFGVRNKALKPAA
ncbi:Prefoldin subunit 3 [Aphelenchoides besseyi]|nr:Prefoldin subunit 3 [Aphelenchoides besseyi]